MIAWNSSAEIIQTLAERGRLQTTFTSMMLIKRQLR